MRIGEVAKISRCPAVTIRYYEKIGLLPNAKRTAANYRIYDQNDLERLRFIRHCRNHGMSLADIEKLLSIKDDGSALHDGDIVAIIESHRKNIKAQIASLDALLRKLDHQLLDLRLCADVDAAGGSPPRPEAGKKATGSSRPWGRRALTVPIIRSSRMPLPERA